MNTEDVLSKLRELKPAVLARYKAREMGLFGSFVRGEQHTNSDVDVLVEFEDSADLFDLMGLALYLEEALQRGKHKMTVIGAAMRKLLHLAYGVVKSGKAFDPNYLKAKPLAA